jgi:hypothetical protein
MIYDSSSNIVPDPNPDPYVFGPPGTRSVIYLYGSRSRSFRQQAKNLDFYSFVHFFYDFLSLKNDVLYMYLCTEDPDPHPDPYQNVTDPEHSSVLTNRKPENIDCQYY